MPAKAANVSIGAGAQLALKAHFARRTKVAVTAAGGPLLAVEPIQSTGTPEVFSRPVGLTLAEMEATLTEAQNLMVNPRFESGTLYAPYSKSGKAAGVTDATAVVSTGGQYSLEMTTVNFVESPGIAILYEWRHALSAEQLAELAEGVPLYFSGSCLVTAPVAEQKGCGVLRLGFRTAEGTLLSKTEQIGVKAGDNGAAAKVVRLKVQNQLAPAGTAIATLSLGLYLSANYNSNKTPIFIDEVMWSPTGIVPQFFDGDSPNASWNTVRWYSSSTRHGEADDFNIRSLAPKVWWEEPWSFV